MGEVPDGLPKGFLMRYLTIFSEKYFMGPWHTPRELTWCVAKDKAFDNTWDIAWDISLDAEFLMTAYGLGHVLPKGFSTGYPMAKFEIPCIISWEFPRDLYRIFHRSSQRISELPFSNSAHSQEFGIPWILHTSQDSEFGHTDCLVLQRGIPSVRCLNHLSAALVATCGGTAR